MNGIVILGATGSIGKSTLEVIQQYPEKYRVVAAVAHRNVDRMVEICEQFKPTVVVMTHPPAADLLRDYIHAKHLPCQIKTTQKSLFEIIELPEVDYVVAGISGSAGIASTFHAVLQGKKILLANKEVMVMAGQLIMATARQTGAQLLPIDSEHSAILQCLPLDQHAHTLDSLHKVTITASGGPFLTTAMDRLHKITAEQACQHPNWVMGKKISIDCATLVNKGLEIIEACHLFQLKPSQVAAVIHPQSIIHALVEYTDGASIAQLSIPDMRIPIAYALSLPARLALNSPRLSLPQIKSLDFFEIDLDRFPGFKLALQALEAGESAPIVFNAANEVAVEAFIRGEIVFTEITSVIAHALEQHQQEAISSLAQIMDIDTMAREITTRAVQKMNKVVKST